MKDHKHVIRDIEVMLEQLADPKFGASAFLDSYQDAIGRTLKMYRLDKDLTMTLVTKYDTARRWQELDGMLNGLKTQPVEYENCSLT